MGSSTSSFSLRTLMISTGVVSAAMAMKFCFPTMLNFAVYEIPVIWSVIVSWLRPPYLYVVINGIIITIAATSRFHHHYNHYHHHESESQPLVDETNSIPIPDLPVELQPVVIQPSFDVVELPPVVLESPVVYESEIPVVYASEIPVVYASEIPVVDVDTVTVPVNDSDLVTIEAEEDKYVISRSDLNLPPPTINSPPPPEIIQSEVNFPVREKPLVSSRFANQRRTTKLNPEGVRSLRVAKPKKHETLESTWKTITDGRHMPLNRHLRKSDTFENHHHAPPSDAYSGEENLASVAMDNSIMIKSETFNDRTDSGNRSHRIPPLKNSLRKEGSLSHDDLNRRVEAFIKKFNDEMRLQRQESLKRYMDMINRGV